MSLFGGTSGDAGDAGIVPGAVAAPPKSGGGPFIDWSSLGSVLSSPFRATEAGTRAIGGAVLNAGKGVPGLLAGAGKEAYGDVGELLLDAPHDISLGAIPRPTGLLKALALEHNVPGSDYGAGHPLTQGLATGVQQTGVDVEQLARAAGNTALPGQPLGNVGELGQGAGLLGRTNLATAAAQGGGGVLPRLINDAANASLVTGPVSSLVGRAAEGAAAESATAAEGLSAAQKASDAAAKAAEQGVTDAATRAKEAADTLEQTRQAAAAGDPAASAQYSQQSQAAQAAAESLREAQSYAEQVAGHHAPLVSAAQQAADEAAQRAETIKGHADTAKLVHDLGQKAANSPFAAAGFAGRNVVDRIVGPAGHALLGTDLGGRYLQPVLDKAGAFAADLSKRAEETRVTRAAMEQGRIAEANEKATLKRGFEQTEKPTNVETPAPRSVLHPLGGGRPGMLPDLDAQAVATMAQTGEDAQLKQLLVNLPPTQAEAVFERATRRPNGEPQYSPSQIDLAMRVFGGAQDEQAVRVRAAIPQTREAYAAGPEAQQAENYARLRGETEPVLKSPAGPGALAQAEHNVSGTGANIEHLQQWRDAVARAEKIRGRFVKGQELAGRALTRAAARLEGHGLLPEEVHNPRALLARVMGPANEVAKAVVEGTTGLERLARDDIEPRIRHIAQRALDGKVPPTITARDLASEILKATTKNPAELSGPVRGLVNQAAQRGMGEVPRGLPNIARAARPAELLGAGRERLRAGTADYERAVTQIAKGQEHIGAATERLAQPSKPPGAAQLGTAHRLAAASSKLADLAEQARGAAARAAGEAPAVAEEVRATTRAEARKLVVDERTALKDWHGAQAKDLRDELERTDALRVNPFPPDVTKRIFTKGEYRTVTNPDWTNPAWIAAGGEVLRSISKEDPGLYRDTRFIGRDGKNPEQLAAAMNSARGEQAGVEGPKTIADWLDTVKAIRYHEAEARRSVVSDKYDVPAADIAHNLQQFGGFDRATAEALASHIAAGHPTRAAEAITDVLTGQRRAEAVASLRSGAERIAERAQPGGDVARALENDRQAEVERGGALGLRAGRASLDEAGKALYDREVAQSKVGVQGQIVAQREGQALNAPSPGRTQGQREGALLGRGQALEQTGAAAAGRADVAMQQGRGVLGNANELTQEAAARVAGPIGRLYGKVGAAEKGVLDATREYAMQTRAIERLDAGLEETRQKMLASIDAQPRPMRPVLEAGRRINETLLPIADEADRMFGAGAGDVYRVAAAEAVVNADMLRRAGIDPQFVIGTKENPVPFSLNPDVASQYRPGEHLPTVGKTGQRVAGRGLAHPTSFEEMFDAASRRQSQMLKNETAQHVLDAVGGSLGDKLEAAGVPREQIANMSQAELITAMRNAHLSAWDASDRLGRVVPNTRVTLDTPVVPAHVWRSYSPYANDVIGGGKILRTYDSLLRHWKAADLYLTGRWHTSLLLGHAVMAMVGGDINPAQYFGTDVPVAIHLERLRRGMGTAEDEAFVQSHATPAQLEGLRTAGGFTPGAVVDRGYTQTEFGAGQLRQGQHGILHPIEGGWRFQSHLDNVNRTAVWLAKLDQGLDARGLADFRTAYPHLAHLSDAEIKNEAAIRLSIRTIGDYKNLSALEQGVIKRIIPFYPWLRHITKLSLNLAIHDPIRVAWMLHAGLMFAPKDSGVDWLQPAYNTGTNQWYTPPRWNPFETLQELPGSGSDSPFAAVSPFINLGSEAATGYNLQQGKPLSRPYQQPGGSTLGVKGVGPGGELGYLAGSTIPGVAALRQTLPALLGHKAIARYGTGQPVLVGGQTLPANDQQVPFTNKAIPGALGPLVPLLGLGNQQNVNADQIAAATAKKQALIRKQLAKYAQERAAAAAAG